MSYGYDGFIGKNLGVAEWKIPKERFLQYQRAIGDLRMEYIEEDKPKVSTAFLAVILRELKIKNVRDIPELIKDPLKILHSAQKYTITGNMPKVGTTVTGRALLENVYIKRNKLYLITKTELYDEKDNKFAEAYTQIVVREGGF